MSRKALLAEIDAGLARLTDLATSLRTKARADTPAAIGHSDLLDHVREQIAAVKSLRTSALAARTVDAAFAAGLRWTALACNRWLSPREAAPAKPKAKPRGRPRKVGAAMPGPWQSVDVLAIYERALARGLSAHGARAEVGKAFSMSGRAAAMAIREAQNARENPVDFPDA